MEGSAGIRGELIFHRFGYRGRRMSSIRNGSFRIYTHLHTVLLPSSRGLVYYSVRRDASTNDGHRHGGGKALGKEVRRCKFIHFNAARYDQQARANSSTFFIRIRYRYVFRPILFIPSGVIVRLHYPPCIMQAANHCKFPDVSVARAARSKTYPRAIIRRGSLLSRSTM